MVNKRSHSVTQDPCFIYVCACVFEKKKFFFYYIKYYVNRCMIFQKPMNCSLIVKIKENTNYFFSGLELQVLNRIIILLLVNLLF